MTLFFLYLSFNLRYFGGDKKKRTPNGLSSEKGQPRLQKNCFELWIGIAGIF